MDEKNKYENEFQKRVEEIRNREFKRRKELDFITEREDVLRQEKNRLLREKEWYKKPQNIIALLGIILPILVTIFFALLKNDTKQLSIYYQKPESLISYTDNMKGNLYVRYDSTVISNISKFSIRIINSGVVAITKDDFIDTPLLFRIKSKDNKEFKLLKVTKRDDAKQQNSKLTVQSSAQGNDISYLPNLLNPGDEVILDVFLANSPDILFESYGKIKEGQVLGPLIEDKAEFTLGFKTFVLSFNTFFTFRWISVSILIVFFVLTSLSSLFQFVELADGELDPPVLGFFMGLSTTILSIFSLVLIIFSFIY